MENEQMVITIKDTQLLRKAAQLAKRRKVDEKAFIQQAFIRAARVALGLETDLSPIEVAGRLGCHLNTVRNYIRDNRFPHIYYQSKRCARIPLADVEALKNQTAVLA